MKCPTCGKESAEHARFCDNCGTSLAPPTATEQKHAEQWSEPQEPKQGVSPWVIVAAVGGGCLVLCLVVGVILAAVLMPVFAQARERARTTSCQSNLKQASTGMLMYSQDYDGKFPLASTWTPGIFPYIKNASVFRCPSVAPPGQAAPMPPFGAPITTDYGFNAALSGFPQSKIVSPAQLTMLFESANNVSAGGAQNVAQPGRHNGGNNFAYADGHVKWVGDGSLGSLVWSPNQPGPNMPPGVPQMGMPSSPPMR